MTVCHLRLRARSRSARRPRLSMSARLFASQRSLVQASDIFALWGRHRRSGSGLKRTQPLRHTHVLSRKAQKGSCTCSSSAHSQQNGLPVSIVVVDNSTVKAAHRRYLSGTRDELSASTVHLRRLTLRKVLRYSSGESVWCIHDFTDTPSEQIYLYQTFQKNFFLATRTTPRSDFRAEL